MNRPDAPVHDRGPGVHWRGIPPLTPGPYRWSMDNRDEVREFLTSRRARLSPREVGLPSAGRRRVPGLRRSEVASLAGVSVEYYARIERSGLAGVSPSVLHALARALRLDEAERAHLLHLAEAAEGTSTLLRPRRSSARPWTPPPSLQWVLDTITGGPAIVRNGRMDLLATNALGRAMHSPLYDRTAAGVPNFARYTFLDDDSRNFYPDWGTAADISVEILRTGRRTTASSRTWSANCRRSAPSSRGAGAATRSACTAPAPRPSTTPPSATSCSPTRASTCCRRPA